MKPRYLTRTLLGVLAVFTLLGRPHFPHPGICQKHPAAMNHLRPNRPPMTSAQEASLVQRANRLVKAMGRPPPRQAALPALARPGCWQPGCRWML